MSQPYDQLFKLLIIGDSGKVQCDVSAPTVDYLPISTLRRNRAPCYFSSGERTNMHFPRL